MLRLTCICGILALACTPCSFLPAAGPVPEGITIVTTTVDNLYNDIKFSFDESKEPEAWKTLADLLDVYVIGVERSQSIVGQVRLRTEKNGKHVYRTVWQIPVPAATVKKFVANIGQLGMTAKEIRGQKGTYKIAGGYTGYLQFIDEFGCFSESREDLTTDLTKARDLMALKPADMDLIVLVSNTADALKARREALDETYKEVIGGIQKRKNEDPDRFELRRLWTEQQMSEVNRFIAESARISLVWNTDAVKKTGVMKTELEALPGTSLASSVEEVAKEPSYFRGVPHDEKSHCSLHVNFPFDELRQKNAQSMAVASKSLSLKEIQKNAKLTESQKKHASDFSEILYDCIDQVVARKLFDGFLNVTKQASGEHLAVGGLRIDGLRMKKTLETHKGTTEIKFAAEKEGDVEIHAVTVPEDWTGVKELFGKDATLFVATSSDAIWYSVGPGGSAPIKEAIRQTVAPSENKLPAILIDAKMGSLAELVDKIQSKIEEGDSKLRKGIVEIMAGTNDQLHFMLDRKDNKIDLELNINEGVFKGAGKIMAKVVRETLD